MQKVLDSSLLNTPLHKRESNVLGDGGCAMVVVSADTARQMKRPAAYKLGESVRYFSGTCVMRDFEKVAEGWRVTAEEALAQAGITREQVSLWNCYLAYPLAHPISPNSSGWRLRARAGSTSSRGGCPLAATSPGRPSAMPPAAGIPAPA